MSSVWFNESMNVYYMY